MTMDGTSREMGETDIFGDDELREIQLRLESLVQVASDYPLECSLGRCDFLFESRDEIERILESLAKEHSALTGDKSAPVRQS
jgi:hypothetical protein